MGTLYLVATPIGNLEDVSLRALRVLREATLIAAEDTRVTRRLLSAYSIKARVISFHEHSALERRDEIVAALAKGDVALTTDAGTPTVSDPGAALVAAAVAAGHRVVPIPGPSAVLAALAASGLADSQFTFFGFLPRRGRMRRSALAELVALSHPVVLFEAPGRLLATLRDLREALGDRDAAVGRELTKLHEEITRGSLSQVIERFESTAPRGEVTLVIAGAAHQPMPEALDVEAELAEAVTRGLRPRSAAADVAARTGRSVRELYGVLLRNKPGRIRKT